MKRILLIISLIVPMLVQAQQFRIGITSHERIMQHMPQYVQVQKDLGVLRAQYETEAQRSEAEFQRKFEEFLEGQNEFPKSILQKRQNELQQMMDSNIAFRKKVQELMIQAEKEMLADIKALVVEAIQAVAEQRGYAIVLNSDADAVPYIHPSLSEDVTDLVLQQLGVGEMQN